VFSIWCLAVWSDDPPNTKNKTPNTNGRRLMSKVAIIGVGQSTFVSTFVRSYPGSIRELVFEGFKDAMQDAQLTTKDIDASVVCSAPEYDKQRSPAGVFAEYLGLNPQPRNRVCTRPWR
jgi:acetyl-CoA acetyltransferase